MKIIAVAMNYASAGSTPAPSAEPILFLKPDTALLKDGKPFFLPDFSHQITAQAEVVIKVGRLGKNIAERFAPRYYGEVTIGVSLTAHDLLCRFRAAALPWGMSCAFDGSAALGAFIPLSEAGDINDLPFRLDVNGLPVQHACTAQMRTSPDRLIAYASRFLTLKTGDLLYTGSPDVAIPIRLGDRLTAYLSDRLLLDFHIR